MSPNQFIIIYYYYFPPWKSIALYAQFPSYGPDGYGDFEVVFQLFWFGNRQPGGARPVRVKTICIKSTHSDNRVTGTVIDSEWFLQLR